MTTPAGPQPTPYGPPRPMPYAPPVHNPSARPDPWSRPPASPRKRVLVGAVSGGVAFLAAGALSFGVTYAVEHADDLLVPTDGLAEDAWWDEEWPDVWVDSPEDGTPDDPWPIGVTVYGTEWDATLGSPRDATAEILAADPSNTAPDDGTEYWVVPVAAYSWSDDAALTEDESVRLSFLDATGTEHTASCGTVPGELVTTGRIRDETTVVGSLCVAVPAGADGVWRLTLGTAGPVHLASAD
ncbi:hypothetical protein [Oerskovia flava]|uniref:hypothetical protein n=1 Tax=Oerskovia flava TaxID=2986422 RepID=UPI00223F84C3|nr:hypothetical protein [Oerskovia sp. JB1-3-2]